MRIALVAGELSGDNIASGLIQKLTSHYPNATIEGVAGPKMIAAGCQSLAPIETLSVMGFAEVLKQIVPIWKLYHALLKHWRKNPPDVFIGIDAPDFNLKLAKHLKQQGCQTVQYVSPSVWAWKAWRIKKIKRATDLVLCLFPFEVEFYQKHQHNAVFVGHPKADEIPINVDTSEVQKALELDTGKRYIALLPGSRKQELHYLLPLFLRTAQKIVSLHPETHFLLPVAKPSLNAQIRQYQDLIDQLPLTVYQGKSQEIMASADIILLASGTATLEAMLWKKPMVVAYQCSSLAYHIVKRLITIPFIALPNILAKKYIVPEFTQQHATVENLSTALINNFNNQSVSMQFSNMHQTLKQDADQLAFEAIYQLITPSPNGKCSQ